MTIRTLVIAYSLSGNNRLLAGEIASRLGAEQRELHEPKSRTGARIFFDTLFGLGARAETLDVDPEGYDRLVLVGPIWMGRLASPIRGFIRDRRGRLPPFAFASSSGGALGPNPRVSEEIAHLAGKPPLAILDLQLAELFPRDQKPSMADTSKRGLVRADLLGTYAKRILEFCRKLES